ncbi:MAG: dihydroorotase [Clostridia bacterium]|nr:dihydroorotase [Clostridia bacterium]
MEYLIKNTVIYNSDKTVKADIYIKDGKIEKIGENLSYENATVVDGSKKIALPGLCDIHCHLRDPGYEYKEDIISGAKSAAAGGFTSIVAMPNTKPVADNKAVIDYINNKAKNACVNVYQAGAITKGLEGKELAEIGEMKKSGIVAVTDDGKPVSDGSMMKKALLYAGMFDLPVIAHEEDMSLVDGGSMNEGYMSTYLGLRGISKAAEEVMVSRDIIIAKSLSEKVHITHISTKGSVELIRQAKKDGVKVTCDTCPHYFSLDETACDGFNTNAKMNPPLRTNEDVEAIIEGLRDGTIDMIATDHAPHHEDEKNCEFDKALNGIIGFETAFALAYDYLVTKNGFSLNKIVELMSRNPSDFIKIEGGEIAEGKVADLILADVENKWTYEAEKSVSKSKNTPYNKFTFGARVTDVFVKGNYIVENCNVKG